MKRPHTALARQPHAFGEHRLRRVHIWSVSTHRHVGEQAQHPRKLAPRVYRSRHLHRKLSEWGRIPDPTGGQQRFGHERGA